VQDRGVDVKYGAPSPDGETAGRRGVKNLLPDLVHD